jgi:hypothetical protein
MKVSLLFITACGFFFFSCGKSDNICNVENPEEDLEWLVTLIDNFSNDDMDQRITLYEYNDADVYYIEDCLNCADALDVVKNCEGNNICAFGGIDGRNTCPDFSDSAKQKEIIFSDI